MEQKTITKKCGENVYPSAGCLKSFTTNVRENNDLCFECWSSDMDSSFGKDKPFQVNWLQLGFGLTILVILFLIFI